ncbi:MAG: ABC transporter substrate-binding protein [Burkholderiales bacterium]|nr:ABC transporter substrate-binding protein [Burkholderiales bacterium]
MNEDCTHAAQPAASLGESRRFTRRRLLGSTSALAAAAAAASLLPPNLRRALAAERPRGSPGSLGDIRHVVLLMQENRSFDHYFGTLAGVRGFGDANALVLPDGRSVFHQPDTASPGGFLLPFHLDTRSTNAQKIPSTSHAWAVQHEAWNGGSMDNWLPAHRKADGDKAPYVMGYHKRADIPFQFALAEAFTICDAYHSSVLGPTWPNRMVWMTGTIDPEGSGGGPIVTNKVPPGGCRWKTYAERLQEAGVSWKVYQQKNNYGCNMLENFAAFREAAPGTPLYERGVVRGAEGEFEYDAANDRLPAVSWIMPTSFQSEHPDFLPAAGAAFVASKIDAIASNPKVWAKTVFILCYDENDGLFDHVAPPVPPAGTPGEFVGGLPVGAGFRVPCIVVSPWTAGGWVCSEPFDHTSVLRLLEAFTGVQEPNLSDWRRRTFGDLTSAFRFEDAKAAPPVLADTAGALARARYEAANLPRPDLSATNQSAPTQEPGRRPRAPRAFPRALALFLALTLALTFAAPRLAAAAEPFVFLTNWYAEAEHGGFYQALAAGLYRKAGLDVTIRMGGPQVNGLQLLAAGQADCLMGYDVQIIKAHERGIRAVTVAAAFQKDPLAMIGHPGAFERMDDLRGKTILISGDAHTNYWPWMRSTWGLKDEQLRPYTFNVQPFLADRQTVQQGYVTSEPYAIQKQGGFEPAVQLLADHGWPPYAMTVVCMQDTLARKPAQVAAFVRASMQGWKDYLEGDPKAADAAIRKDNPAMSDALLAYGRRQIVERGMVLGGDAALLGIGIVTDARMRKTYDLLVALGLVDPAKVDLARTYTTRFVKDLKIMP